jgi:single-stranded-DNA-specific exonuclease
VEHAVLREAEEMLAAIPDMRDVPSIVLGSRNWHPGVVGIVASRISRMCHRPTILIAIDENGLGKGSGRSIPGLSLVAAIEHCREWLHKGGGHAMAIGISISEENIPAFRERFAQVVRDTLSNEQLRPTTEIDAELTLAELTPAFTEQYRLLEPYGMANPEPLFLLRRVDPRLPGRIMKEKHLRVTLRQDGAQYDSIYFNAPLDNLPPAPWDVLVRVQRNWYRGTESWQMTIESLRAAV